MARNLSTTLSDLDSAITAEHNAWAAFAGYAQNAHLAAVMGPSLLRHLRPSSEWDIASAMSTDQALQRELLLAQVHAPGLQVAIEEHIRWTVQEIEDGIVDDIRNHNPAFVITANPTETREARAARTAHGAAAALTPTRLAAVRTEANALVSARGVAGVTKSRQSVIDTHADQTSVIERQATHLAFGDKALASIEREIDNLKSSFGPTQDARDFFKGSTYKGLGKERSTVTKEREHIELQLQSYFDHFAQGASRSETAKPNREPLRFAADLELGKAGYKQIQLMDAFMLGRGNELWALIPDILRIGHDIDPVSFMHWKPSTDESDYPESIRRYRREQNKSFAQKLLNPNLCSQGLRARLLATHKHGANKIEVKASEDDGTAIYWVLCQLFHPISREYRRTLEADLAKMHTQFRSGNPKPALDLLRCKVQEALDVAARIKWDVVAIPLINTLETRDPKFAVALGDYRDKPIDPDDSCVELDQLVSTVKEVIDQCDEARKDWEERAARKAGSKDDYTSSLERRIKALEASKPTNTTNPKGLRGQETGTCMKPKCGRVIKPWKPGWKLCSTCLLKTIEGKVPITLTDGSTWTPHQARCSLGEMKALKVAAVKKVKIGKKAKKQPKGARISKRPHSDTETPGGEDVDAEEEAEQRIVRFSAGTERLYDELQRASTGKRAKK